MATAQVASDDSQRAVVLRYVRSTNNGNGLWAIPGDVRYKIRAFEVLPRPVGGRAGNIGVEMKVPPTH